MTRRPSLLALAGLGLGLLSACPKVGDAERLYVAGDLEREGLDDTNTAAVAVDYLSESSRGEWWPCDARLTALGCVGDHHVNVYLTRAEVTAVSDIGRAWCVVDGVPNGVYEAFDTPGADSFDLGTDLNAFVIVASDVDGPAGAELTSDTETTGASRIVGGTLSVVVFEGLEGRLSFRLDGTTTHGNSVHIEFNGEMSAPGVVPLLEGPNTCVDGALVGP